MNLLQRLDNGPIICAEGYLFAMERRGYLSAGAFVPEVVIEHPEVVKNRLVQFSKVIDKGQLMAGTDCGFSTFAGFGNVDENIVYKKLESLVIGTELANKVL